MTEVVCRRTNRGAHGPDGAWFDFTMEGHAEFAAPGQPDIVCAACSAIGYALLGALENMEGPVRGLQSWEKEGMLHIRCGADRAAQACFRMAVIGLMQVAAQYPACVRVTADAL